MNWADPYQAKRDHYWPEVEQFFGHLPPRLFQQGLLLKNNLATFYSDTGQFKDILRRDHDHPLLYLHLWLLDDWISPDSAARQELERRLFLAMTFAFTAVYTQECILDESTNFDNNYLFLQQALTQQSDFYLAPLFPATASFWQYHRAFWDEYAEAILMTGDRRPETAGSQPPTPDPRPIAGMLAFSKIPVTAVALTLGQEDRISGLCNLLDHLNAVLQTLRELSTLRRDLGQHRLTYPILKTMQAAGLDPLQSLSPEQLLGALVLTGTVEKIGQECLASLAEARTLSNSLDQPTFIAYLETVERQVDEVRNLFSLKKKAAVSPEKRAAPFFIPYVDTLPKVIEMAEGYLLSDLTFRESWEVQRRGVFGQAEMTGKAFPMGLITELLSRHGHNMAAPINEIFETLRASGFRYYDHPHLPPDADDLGVLLRLYSYSAQPEHHRELLQTPLRRLEQSISESGEIPVWLKDNDPENLESLPLALWGNSCATVEANVLLGLLDFDRDGYQNLIEKSVGNWHRRITADRLSATHHYVPLYALWTAFELFTKLTPVIMSEAKNLPENPDKGRLIGGQSDSTYNDLPAHLNQTIQTLAELLTAEASRPHLTPQDAAFLILTCLRLNTWSPKLALAPPLLNPNWITLLCKTQRYDGSWAGEPLYGTPTRGEFAAWYNSRTVTTAFCYHALKTYPATPNTESGV